MCWDALMEEHRLQKYQTLQQRVGIQRNLISKNDQLSSELRRKYEEERLEVNKNYNLHLFLSPRHPLSDSFPQDCNKIINFYLAVRQQKIQARKLAQKKLTKSLRTHIRKSRSNLV